MRPLRFRRPRQTSKKQRLTKIICRTTNCPKPVNEIGVTVARLWPCISIAQSRYYAEPIFRVTQLFIVYGVEYPPRFLE
jgi:hypothetical protein